MVYMKRGWHRWLIAVVVTVTVSGCGKALGDGDLADDWKAMADAKPWVPDVGCYDAGIRSSNEVNVTRKTIPCDQSHTTEAFHVGQFPESSSRPAAGSAAHWKAFEDCEALAATFLGGQWYTARVAVTVDWPSIAQWEGGGRWFRCDAMEVGYTTEEVTRRTGSLKDTAKPDGALARKCVSVVGLTETGWDSLTASECTVSHDAEYAGSVKLAGVDYPASAKSDGTHAKCRPVVDTYVANNRFGYLSQISSREAWARGVRYVHCYAWSSSVKLTKTVKGLGNNPPG
jgi:hypothetical protein